MEIVKVGVVSPPRNGKMHDKEQFLAGNVKTKVLIISFFIAVLYIGMLPVANI